MYNFPQNEYETYSQIYIWRWNTTVMLPIGRNVKSAHYPPQKDWFIYMEPP